MTARADPPPSPLVMLIATGWLSIPQISTTRTTSSNLKILNTKKDHNRWLWKSAKFDLCNYGKREITLAKKENILTEG